MTWTAGVLHAGGTACIPGTGGSMHLVVPFSRNTTSHVRPGGGSSSAGSATNHIVATASPRTRTPNAPSGVRPEQRDADSRTLTARVRRISARRSRTPNSPAVVQPSVPAGLRRGLGAAVPCIARRGGVKRPMRHRQGRARLEPCQGCWQRRCEGNAEVAKKIAEYFVKHQ